MIILKWIVEIECASMDWFNPAQDKDQWRALVNGVMNFWANDFFLKKDSHPLSQPVILVSPSNFFHGT
jgi:hypothetical protein